MKRRQLLKGLGALGTLSLLPQAGLYAAPEDYTGQLFITLNAQGGWDVTSLCDPKMNVPGEDPINFWANDGETQQAGNIHYAPFAGNQAFFEKYFNDMLVINGIDAQTNSHTTGVTHNWSGRVSEGYPSLSALFASVHSPELPFAYISNGGYSDTANLIRFTRFNNPRSLENLLTPERNVWSTNEPYASEEEWTLLLQAREARLQRLLAQEGRTPRQLLNRQNSLTALQRSGGLSDFADALPSRQELRPAVQLPVAGVRDNTQRQIQLALVSFQQGMACSADIVQHGYDTHTNHDAQHAELFSELTTSIDYLWTYAGELGIADRITLFVTSDFGRTPRYNSSNFGKDHWPIGSAIVMEQNATWGNRVVGVTDEGHSAIPIDPLTLQEDTDNGTLIYPKHVHKALRRYLGLENHPNETLFPFNNTEDIDFFNPDLQTAGRSSDPRNSVRTV